MSETLNDSAIVQKYVNLRKQARLARFDKSRVFVARCVAYLIVLVGVMDAVSTNAALEAGGYEMNPIVRYIMHHLGAMWVTPKLLVHVLLAFMVLWFPNKPTIITMICTMMLTTYAVMGNFTIALMVP